MNAMPNDLGSEIRASGAQSAPKNVTRPCPAWGPVWERHRPNPEMCHGLKTAVHIWSASLQIPPQMASEIACVLSPDEREHAARFRFELHRNRFIAGRAFLRRVLASYLRAQPAEIRFSYEPNGKPLLSGGLEATGVHFNLSHSEGLALLALTRTGPVGVDVERIRPLKDASDLVARFFSRRENALFQPLAEEQKPVAFFNLWTRKEAWLKATGEGLSELLNQVEVSFLPEEPAQLLSVPGGFAARNWSLKDVSPAQDFAGALALSVDECDVQCWTLQSP